SETEPRCAPRIHARSDTRRLYDGGFPRGPYGHGTPRGPAGLGGNGCDLGCVRDLGDDLDDVPIRVEHAQLPRGAVAAREDVAHALELPLGAELARVRRDLLQSPPDQLRDGDAVALARREVHHRRLEAVAAGEPLVLGREDAVVRRYLLTGL